MVSACVFFLKKKFPILLENLPESDVKILEEMKKLKNIIAGALIGLGSLGCPNSLTPQDTTPNVTEQVMTDENEEQLDCTGERYFDVGILSKPKRYLEDAVKAITTHRTIYLEANGNDVYNGLQRELAVGTFRRAVEVANCYITRSRVNIGNGTFQEPEEVIVRSETVVEGNGYENTTLNASVVGNGSLFIRNLTSEGVTTYSNIIHKELDGFVTYCSSVGDLRGCLLTDKASVNLTVYSPNVTLNGNVFYNAHGGTGNTRRSAIFIQGLGYSPSFKARDEKTNYGATITNNEFNYLTTGIWNYAFVPVNAGLLSQAGNAMTVSTIEAVGKRLLEYIKE